MVDLIFADYAAANDFQLSAVQSAYKVGQEEPPHAHEFYELVVVESGKGTHELYGKSLDIGAGDVFLIIPGQEHAYQNNDQLILVSIIFMPAILQEVYEEFNRLQGFQLLFNVEPKLSQSPREIGRLSLPEHILPEAVRMVETLQHELSRKKPGYKIATRMTFYLLLLLIVRHCSLSGGKMQQYSRMIGEILTFIDQNLPHKLTIEMLAGKAKMAESTFRMVFAEYMKVSPINYILQLRLKKAAILLRGSKMNISEIAFAVGFNDSNYFSHQFKKLYKMNPIKYRNEPSGVYHQDIKTKYP